MKLIHLLLTVALVVPFMGCGALSLEDPKIAELEARIAELEGQIDHWKGANTRLQNEKAAALNKVANLTQPESSPWSGKKGDKLTFRVNFDHNKPYNRKDYKKV